MRSNQEPLKTGSHGHALNIQFSVHRFHSTIIYSHGGQGGLAFQREVLLSTGMYCLPGAESAQLFTWQLLLKSQHRTSLGAGRTCWLLQALLRPAAQQHDQVPCSLSSYTRHRALGPVRSYLSEGPTGAAGRRPWRIRIHKSLSCLFPQKGSGPLCPAFCVNPLVSPWPTQLAVSCQQGSGSSFSSTVSIPQFTFPRVTLTGRLESGKKRTVLDNGALTVSQQ